MSVLNRAVRKSGASSGVRRRSARVVTGVVAMVVALLCAPQSMLAGVAAAEPTSSPDSLLAKYTTISREAEESSEALNHAKVEHEKQVGIRAESVKVAAAAQKELDRTQARVDSFQDTVDAVVRASTHGARVNRLYAVLVSDSPQALLDQMSGLEIISQQTQDGLRELRKARAAATAAKASAETAKAGADAALAKLQETSGELQAKRANLELQAIQVRAVYASMTGKQLAELRGPKYDFDPRLVPKGTSAALVAVHSALTRIGDPYVWGATGPDQFDCSGLMMWAYNKAGKSIPRTSEAQMAGGTPVDRKDLQPGDLIIYYPSASHVGMYVGDGYVIHASTFGVPVKVVPVDEAGPYTTARRY